MHVSPRPICGRAPQLALCKTCLGCEKRRSRRTGGPDGDGDDAMPGACVVCWRDLSEGGKAAGAEAGRQCSTCKGAEVASEAAAEPNLKSGGPEAGGQWKSQARLPPNLT